MRLFTLIFFLVVCAACGTEGDTVPSPPPSAVTLATEADIAGNHVIPQSYVVTFRATPGVARRTYASFALESRVNYARLPGAVTADPRVANLRHITTVDLADPKDPERVKGLSPPRALQLAWGAAGTAEIPAAVTQVDFKDEAAAAAALKEWDERGLLWFAEPNHVSQIKQSVLNQDLVSAYRTMGIWWHQAIHLNEALSSLVARGVTPASPIVAVLDSGVDKDNEYIKDNIWKIPDVAIGHADCGQDAYGCNATTGAKGTFGDGDTWPYGTTGYGQPCPTGAAEAAESCGHGTHVAGIIAAKPASVGGKSIGGVCPFCRILIIKIIDKAGAADTSILNGFKYLTRFKQGNGTSDLISVANASIGTFNRSRAIALLITLLSRPPNNLLVVAASGNEDSQIRSFPAAYPEVIAVSAAAQDDGKAIYSNFGPWVSISAPGGDASRGPRITSTVPGVNGVDDKQGTSMASPVVAGVAGLVLAADPTRSGEALKTSLILNADPRIYDESVLGGNNRKYFYPPFAGEPREPLLGSGMVDAAAAIEDNRRTALPLPANDKVTRSCGVAGGPASGMVLLLPLVLALFAGLRTYLGRVMRDFERSTVHQRSCVCSALLRRFWARKDLQEQDLQRPRPRSRVHRQGQSACEV